MTDAYLVAHDTPDVPWHDEQQRLGPVSCTTLHGCRPNTNFMRGGQSGALHGEPYALANEADYTRAVLGELCEERRHGAGHLCCGELGSLAGDVSQRLDEEKRKRECILRRTGARRGFV